MNDDRARALLLELTALPTAAGREDAGVEFVRGWARRRKRLGLREDDAGNLWLGLADEPGGGPPVLLVAHMDHPAAVVVEAPEGEPNRVVADFLGGVALGHMHGAAMRLYPSTGGRPRRGRVEEATQAAPAKGAGVGPGERPDPRLTVAFKGPADARPGDVLTWDLGGSVVRGSRLHAPACDNLAGVAAALVAMDAAAARRPGAKPPAPLRVLLTRAEEVGFVGAIAACAAGSVPADARIVVLECSKASADVALGAGPVVRVGDRTSTFDPGLTAGLAAAAGRLAADPKVRLRWQRKLMTGGTCEATAFSAFGFAAACVCLPLGHYHNMSDDRAGVLEREVISLRDFEGLCALLKALPADGGTPTEPHTDLRARLGAVHRRRAPLLRRIPGGHANAAQR